MSDSERASDSTPPSPAHVGGQGTPLVLLHGLGGTWEVWKPLLPALESRHRVIALTLPGHYGGPEPACRDDATVGGLADQLIAALCGMGLAHAHVAGNSLGGWLALELARRGYARSVVAFSPAGGWRSDAEYHAIATPFRIAHAVVGLLLFAVALLARYAWVRRALTRKTMEHGERLTPREFLGSLRAMARTRVLPGLLRTMGRDGPAAPLPEGKVPVTIAWGEHDRVIPYERYGAPFRERVRGVRETVLPGAGHVPMWDNPGQMASEILRVTQDVDARPPLPHPAGAMA